MELCPFFPLFLVRWLTDQEQNEERRVALPRSRGPLKEQRRRHERDGAQQLDEHMQGGTCCILERISYRVTDNCGLVCFGALSAKHARLNVFLGIVPGCPAIVHHECEQDASHRSHHQE